MTMDAPLPSSAPVTNDIAVQRVSLDRTRRRVFIPLAEPHARRRVGLGLFLADLIVAVLPMIYRDRALARFQGFEAALPIIVLAVICWFSIYVVGGYRRRSIIQSTRLRYFALAGVMGAFVALLAYKVCYGWASERPAVYRFTFVTLVAPFAFGAWVVMSRGVVRNLLSRSEAAARILVIGNGPSAANLRETVRQRMPKAPLLVFDGEGDAAAGILPFRDFDAQLQGTVRAVILDRSVDTLPNDLLEDLVHARLMDIPIQRPATFTEDLLERTPIAQGDTSWLFEDQDLHPGRSLFYHSSKRLIDLVTAIIGICLSAPIMLVVAIAVKATSRGPVFFTQLREGRWRRPFTIIKFRTMRTDAEQGGAQWAKKDDPRVTPIGAFLRKSRLDELPQFFNVLVGDMSLVGPRPERPEFNSMLIAKIPWYDIRHLTKPGLTGWAQVCYPYGASVEDAVAKLEYEVYYIKNASLRFDLRVILRTCAIVFGLRGR